jgi:superfamily II DNA or RNA helicase/HKD family nuclease
MKHPRGLYDLPLSETLARALESLDRDTATLEDLRPDDAPERLVGALGVQLRRILADIEGGDDGDRARRQLALINALLAQVRSENTSGRDDVDPLADPPRLLRAIHGPAESPPLSPETGLAVPWLFTVGRGSPSLLTELRREAAACDQIDILVSFITVSGVRKLIDVLELVTAANAQGEGRTRIRVLTTTYTGATQLAALDQLARLNGCEVRISLDGRRTRLHAKAWIFHRKTGFGSAYVGSANLSGAALMGGLEWTIKFTQRGQQALFDRAAAHFDTLWLDGEFTRYAPDDAASRAAVAKALRIEGGVDAYAPAGWFDIQPKPFQQEMLDELARERAAGRNRNLLVAATGSGKTVVAALDYRETCRTLGGQRPRLLFVAHRAQILRQARRTFQEVLRDHSFGELLTGGLHPESHEHLFASIDSLTTRDLVAKLGADYWHTIVIDECHRIAADRFDRLATAVRPRILLGLTATPERTDGQRIERYFTPRPDGSPAVELRLWDALDMQLLAPFEYYGCDDPTDFSEVPWDGVGEVAALDRILTGNDVRARVVIEEWRRLAADPRKSRALVFCVSVDHARFMTEKLNAAGIPAMLVTGETPAREQLSAPGRLARGAVCALVTVDLYNEGVDLPDVDTLLLLRPTQSALLFQQQIGRDLRLSPGKESCLILDFVGQHRADFRFDRLLSTISGLTRNELLEAVERGFGALPPGCHIHLERQTRHQVLAGLRSAVNQSWRRLITELQSYAVLKGTRDVSLGEFLHDQHVDIREVYRTAKPSGWTTLQRKAGLIAGDERDGEAELSRSFRSLLHADDPAYLELVQRVAAEGEVFAPRSEHDAIRAQMLTYQVDTGRATLGYRDFVRRVAEHPPCAAELRELTRLREAESRMDARPLPGLDDVPLSLHAAYRRNEILTAVGTWDAMRRTPFQAGVLALPDRKVELLFVTLDKSEGFHDRIAYHDYAVSATRFHWQTQNSAGPDTAAGRRYLESRSNGWTFQLFVRATKDDAYRACGPVRIASEDDISGDRPMSIEWTLEVPLPARMFAEFSVLRGQG